MQVVELASEEHGEWIYIVKWASKNDVSYPHHDCVMKQIWSM